MLSLWCVLAKRAEDCIYVSLCASCLLGKSAWTGGETSSYSERKKKRYLEVLTWPQYPEECIRGISPT